MMYASNEIIKQFNKDFEKDFVKKDKPRYRILFPFYEHEKKYTHFIAPVLHDGFIDSGLNSKWLFYLKNGSSFIA